MRIKPRRESEGSLNESALCGEEVFQSQCWSESNGRSRAAISAVAPITGYLRAHLLSKCDAGDAGKVGVSLFT